MAADRSIILTWLADLASTVMDDAIDLADTSARISAASSVAADAFARESLEIARIIGESVTTPEEFDLIAVPDLDAGQTRDAVTILVAVGVSIAGAKAEWPSRPTARAARSRVVQAGDAALAVVSTYGAAAADLYAWLFSLVSIGVRVISEIAANSVPIVRVETGISTPSTLIAYRLYNDAARAQSLVDIGQSGTPLLMPLGFDALAR